MKTHYGWLLMDKEDIHISPVGDCVLILEPDQRVELTPELVRYIAKVVNERKG